MLPFYYLTVPIAIMAAFNTSRRVEPVAWYGAFLAVVFFVGLRHHVGMDWNNYLGMIQRVNSGDFWNAFRYADPGYVILLWVSGQYGWGIYGTYLLGTIVFAAGVFKYARTTHTPWLALLVAIPFPTIVTAMAAARQTVSIGVLFWLVAIWDDCPLWKRIALVVLASMFHSSAIFFLLFVFLDLKTSLTIKLVGCVVAAGAMYFFLERAGHVDYYDQTYVSGQSAVTSSGAIFHVLLNGGPAILAFLGGKRIREILLPNKLHRNMALMAISLIPLTFVLSVISGRMTLYLFPVSMWIFAATPGLFMKTDRLVIRAVLSVSLVGLLAFWLNFANSARAYQNYQNALFVPPEQLQLCCR